MVDINVKNIGTSGIASNAAYQKPAFNPVASKAPVSAKAAPSAAFVSLAVFTSSKSSGAYLANTVRPFVTSILAAGQAAAYVTGNPVRPNSSLAK